VGDSLLEIAHHLNPSVVVCSGDLTQRAKVGEYARARDWLAQLPRVPLVVVPGNHDVPLYRVYERLFHPLDNYKEYISPHLDGVLRTDAAHFVWLNSTAPLHAITNGRIRQKQLDFCAAAFRETPRDVARIVVAHHQFAPAPDYEKRQFLPGAQRALEHFTRLRVDMILGGHLHRAYIGNSLDVYSGTDRQHSIAIVQCGTSTSQRGRGREREKNTFNFIRIGKNSFQLEHFMFFSEEDHDDGFQVISRHLFPRANAQWLARAQPEKLAESW
jgi:3',5'-cyclic AMP phosphodiesterase CpdA